MGFTEKLAQLFIPQKTQSPVVQPSYGTDCRAIEQWAQQAASVVNDLITYVNAIPPSSGYASLTGPGETSPTGALTQAGNFTVSGNETVTGNLQVSGGTGANISNNLNVNGDTSVALLFISNSISASTGAGTSVDLVYENTFLFMNVFSNSASFGVSTGSSDSATVACVLGSGVSIGGVGSSNPVNISTTLANITIASSSAEVIIKGAAVQIQGNALSDLGFYGTTPVAQQSSTGITTVAQVVTVLKNYGLLL